MSTASDVQAAWARLASWLEESAPDLHAELQPGVSDDELMKLEAKWGRPIHDDFKSLYRLCNGDNESGVFPAWEEEEETYSLMPLGDIARYCKPSNRWEDWEDGWLPFATNGGGDYHFLDLNDSSAAPVVAFDHETGQAGNVAASLASRLNEIVDGLEHGKYVFDEEYGIIIPFEDDED